MTLILDPKLILGLLIIAAAVYAVLRKVDVRLSLLLAAFALGAVAGDVPAIAQKFFSTFAAPEYLIPICSAMGFAYALRHTHCDQHLVHLLVNPLRRVQVVLIPGAVLVGFIVNIPIISQTSAAVTIGSVLIPLLLAARISPATAGAALLLGASMGGELLNPGAPEFRTVIKETTSLGVPLDSSQCVRAVLPLVLVHLLVATIVFWALSLRAEARQHTDNAPQPAEVDAPIEEDASPEETDSFKVNLFKAAVPLLPLALLFLIARPLEVIAIPHGWLVGAKETAHLLEKASGFLKEPRLAQAVQETFDSRLIGAAMLLGTLVAALTERRRALGVASAFFEGAGYAFGHIVSIIVAAACFGEGVKLIGFDKIIGALVTAWPGALLPAAGFMPLAFGAISGSGMAATQSLFGFFAAPSLHLDINPVHAGAVVSLGAAAGRTMSLVAAVTLMCASLTGTTPAQLAKRVAPPLLIGMLAVVIAAILLAPHAALPLAK